MSLTIPHMTSRARGTYRDDHGTPDWIIDLVRDVCGPIVYDLASSDEAQKHVRAQHYWTAERPLTPFAPADGDNIFCNPPGPLIQVKRFWAAWQAAVQDSGVGAFLFFNIDHLRSCIPTIDRVVDLWVPAKRLKFRGNASGASFSSAITFVGLECYGWAKLQESGQVWTVANRE